MSYFGLPYIHAAFDVAAWLASMAVFWLTTRHLIPAEALPANRVPHPGAYAIAAGAGALSGAMFFGTANALLSGVDALGFSMVGGIAGAIMAIEAYKRFTGVSGSTGIVFAAPFAATVAVGRLGSLLCCLPDVPMPEGSGYENVFRVTIVEFLDRFNFCLANVKRSCVHFVTSEGAIIPFDTYNTFYRPGAAGNARLAEARLVETAR